MKALAVISFVLGSLLSVGCAHNAPASSPAVIAPAVFPEASAPTAQAAAPEVKRFNLTELKLAAYTAVSDLESYIESKETNSTTAEKLIEAAQKAAEALIAADNNYWRSFELKRRANKFAQKIRIDAVALQLDVLRDYANKKDYPSWGTAEKAVAKMEALVAKARLLGEGVDDLITNLSVIESRARVGYAEKQLQQLQDYLDGKRDIWPNEVLETEQAIVAAILAGDDSVALVTRLKKIRPQVCAKDQRTCIR